MYSPRHELRARFSADDWGLSPGVNEAILELAGSGLLRSVSLFANLPYLHTGLGELERTGVELHAHLNFTLGRPLTDAPCLRSSSGALHPFPSFVVRGLLGRLRQAEIEEEAGAQLDLLQAECRIAAVNGHQHCHLLPWMAGPLAAAAGKRGIGRFRRMGDMGHLPSRLADQWSARRWKQAWPEATGEDTHYLWPTGKLGEAGVLRKVRAAGDRALLVHPAARDDFLSVEFADGLRGARVSEFEVLRRLAP